jgi:hypothetical protein
MKIFDIHNTDPVVSVEEIESHIAGTAVALEHLSSMMQMQSVLAQSSDITTTRIARIATSHIARQMDLSIPQISTESMETSLESIGSFIKSIWEAIKRTFKAIWDKITWIFRAHRSESSKRYERFKDDEDEIRRLRKRVKRLEQAYAAGADVASTGTDASTTSNPSRPVGTRMSPISDVPGESDDDVIPRSLILNDAVLRAGLGYIGPHITPDAVIKAVDDLQTRSDRLMGLFTTFEGASDRLNDLLAEIFEDTSMHDSSVEISNQFKSAYQGIAVAGKVFASWNIATRRFDEVRTADIPDAIRAQAPPDFYPTQHAWSGWRSRQTVYFIASAPSTFSLRHPAAKIYISPLPTTVEDVDVSVIDPSTLLDTYFKDLLHLLKKSDRLETDANAIAMRARSTFEKDIRICDGMVLDAAMRPDAKSGIERLRTVFLTATSILLGLEQIKGLYSDTIGIHVEYCAKCRQWYQDVN